MPLQCQFYVDNCCVVYRIVHVCMFNTGIFFLNFFNLWLFIFLDGSQIWSSGCTQLHSWLFITTHCSQPGDNSVLQMKKLSLRQDPYLPNSQVMSSDFGSLVILTHCPSWAVWELIPKMVPDDLCLLCYFLLHLLWLLYHHFDTMEMLIDVFWC